MKRHLLNTFLTLFFVSGCLVSVGQNRAIRFTEKPWAEILAQARAENRMIFLDAYTTWCGPCKWIAANIFTKDSVADRYNASFLCTHFDMEKGEGLTLAQLYQVKAYPTLLFLNPDGEVVHKRVGAPQQVKDYLDMAEVATTPGEGLAACEKQFGEGKRDPSFMLKYMDRLQGAYIPVNEPLNQYFGQVPDTEMTLRPNWELIYRYVTDVDSKAFNILVSRRSEFEALYTSDSVNAKLYNTYLQALTGKTRSRDFTEAGYEEMKRKIRATGFPDADKVVFNGDLNLFQMKGDMGGFLRLASQSFERFYGNDPPMLERMAAMFLQIASEKNELEKAAAWAKRSAALMPSPANHDIYAQLMYKLGNKKEAVKYEQLAIGLAKRENLPVADYEENLKKFQQ